MKPDSAPETAATSRTLTWLHGVIPPEAQDDLARDLAWAERVLRRARRQDETADVFVAAAEQTRAHSGDGASSDAREHR